MRSNHTLDVLCRCNHSRVAHKNVSGKYQGKCLDKACGCVAFEKAVVVEAKKAKK
jgi:hypothetical protein